MNSYRVATTFEQCGLRPPSTESVTVGESDMKFIQLKNGDDTSLLQYVQDGGIAFPHIMVPEALKLRTAQSAISKESILLQSELNNTNSVAGATAADSNGSAVATFVNSVLWLWNIKQHASTFTDQRRLDLLRLAESCMPAPVARIVLGSVNGTASAALAAQMEAEEAEGQRSIMTNIEGPISCIAWHPHRSLIAVAHRATDTVLLYDLANNTWCANILENMHMQGITSMAWQPCNGYTLAVGCRSGVCLWKLLPGAPASGYNSAQSATAPSLGTVHLSAWMSLLSFPPLPDVSESASHSNQVRPMNQNAAIPRSSTSVSALAFAPDGQWLITGHQTHGHLTVWDTALETATPLRRSGSTSRAATLSISVSPSGNYVASTHANNQLRLWETESWGSRVWSDFPANVSQLVWSPDSRSAFFSVVNGSSIFALAVYMGPPTLEVDISVVSTFEGHATTAVDDATESIRVGGAIRSLALDPTGQRLVAGFDADATSSDVTLLAAYMVNTAPLFQAGGDAHVLSPLGYIRGPNWGKQQKPHTDDNGDDNQSKSSLKVEKPATNKKRVRV
ncbi:hypothetical protein EC988_005611, partial [Linderina pennispora]